MAVFGDFSKNPQAFQILFRKIATFSAAA